MPIDFNKDARLVNEEGIVSSTNGSRQLDIHIQKNKNWTPTSHHI